MYALFFATASTRRIPCFATWILLAALCRPASAAPPLWWQLDSAPAGTPPTIQCLPGSDPHHTMLDVVIHGFWYETIVQQGQTFRRLSFDKTHDDAAYQQVGRPELPAIHHVIGDLVGGQVGPPEVQILDQTTIPGAQIYPDQLPYVEDAPMPPFQWDMIFYQQTSTPYPSALGAARGYQGRMDGLDLLGAETYPFRAIPATQTLLVMKHYQVILAHSGPQPVLTKAVTRRKAMLYSHVVSNAPVVSVYRPANLVIYQGEYLIICGPTFEDEIQPLAEQKRRRGYGTRVVTTLEAGDDCEEIRTYITGWYDERPGADHYVLLVGDMGEIGICASENLTASDLKYVCIDGLGADGLPDPYPEAKLGRFPAITEQDVTDMVDKTLTYEDGYRLSGSWLGDATLACHKCAEAGECDTYKDAQEAVFSAAYSNPPSFTKRYGQDGATNAQIKADVNAGLGVLGYRGHGSTTTWPQWNDSGQSLTLLDVSALANGEMTPVVFSIACATNDISGVYVLVPECIGEKFMKTTGRAVAHFGASQCSDRSANDALDLALFQNVYDLGITTIGETISAAEATMMSEDASGEANAWMYLLLGDPELEIWTETPPPLFVVASAGPDVVIAHVSGGGSRSAISLPTVAVYKPGEVAAAYYADANGDVTIPIDPLTPGPLYVTAYTEIGSEGVALDTVTVVPTGTPDLAPGVGGSLVLHAPRPNPARGVTRVSYELPRSGPMRLRIVDVAGRSVVELANRVEATGAGAVTWDGRDAAGRHVSPGMYFVRLEQAGAVRTQKVTLVR